MGYRSTVAYTIRFTPVIREHEGIDEEKAFKEAKDSFYVFLAEAKSKLSGVFGDKCLSVDESNMAINFLAENVKWYEDYEDVKAHTALQDLSKSWVDDENKHIGGIFMRIGEESDDVIEEGWGEHDWDWMCVSRQIIVDWM